MRRRSTRGRPGGPRCRCTPTRGRLSRSSIGRTVGCRSFAGRWIDPEDGGGSCRSAMSRRGAHWPIESVAFDHRRGRAGVTHRPIDSDGERLWVARWPVDDGGERPVLDARREHIARRTTRGGTSTPSPPRTATRGRAAEQPLTAAGDQGSHVGAAATGDGDRGSSRDMEAGAPVDAAYVEGARRGDDSLELAGPGWNRQPRGPTKVPVLGSEAALEAQRAILSLLGGPDSPPPDPAENNCKIWAAPNRPDRPDHRRGSAIRAV